MLIILFALFAGFCSAFSPCIAPILPLYVLRGISPVRLGIAVSTATAAIMFASAYFLEWFGVVGRWVGIILLIITGMMLVADRQMTWFNRWAGVGIGFAWAPCLGPIAAGILSLGGVTTPFAIVSYAIGLCGGIILCAYATRRLRLTLTNPWWRRGIGISLICLGLLLAVGSSFHLTQRIQSQFPAWSGAVWNWQDSVVDQFDERVAPNWQGTWANKPPVLRGKRSLVVVWSYTCEACEISMPRVKALAEKHHLQIILVHSPQYVWATDRGQIKAAARRYGLADAPLLYDDHRDTMKALGASRWPWHAYINENAVIKAARSGTKLDELEPALGGQAGPEEGGFAHTSDQWELSGTWKHQGTSVVAGSDARIRLAQPGLIWVTPGKNARLVYGQTSLYIDKSDWYSVDGWIGVSGGSTVQAWRTGPVADSQAPLPPATMR